MAAGDKTKSKSTPEVVESDSGKKAAEPKSKVSESKSAETKSDEKAEAKSDEKTSTAAGTSEPGAGTKAGEQIAGTPAHGEAAPDGGTTPEATQGAPVPDTGEKVSEDSVDRHADGGGQQASGTAHMPQVSEQVDQGEGEVADSIQGAVGGATSEQEDQDTAPVVGAEGTDPDALTVNQAIQANTPATPPNVSVAEGMAEATTAPETSTESMRLDASFASRSRQAPHLADS